MAFNLSKTGIADGSQLWAYHVTQSIDALKGTHAYNLNPSGSVAVTGSLKLLFSGSITDFNYSASTLLGANFSTFQFPQSFIDQTNNTNDTNAGLNGIPVGGLYHNAGTLRIRLT